jgi:hypothetical protein
VLLAYAGMRLFPGFRTLYEPLLRRLAHVELPPEGPSLAPRCRWTSHLRGVARPVGGRRPRSPGAPRIVCSCFLVFFAVVDVMVVADTATASPSRRRVVLSSQTPSWSCCRPRRGCARCHSRRATHRWLCASRRS